MTEIRKKFVENFKEGCHKKIDLAKNEEHPNFDTIKQINDILIDVSDAELAFLSKLEYIINDKEGNTELP